MPVLQAWPVPGSRRPLLPGLLGAPVEEADLVSCALAEGGRTRGGVKVIADFPGKAAGTGAEITYLIGSIAQLVRPRRPQRDQRHQRFGHGLTACLVNQLRQVPRATRRRHTPQRALSGKLDSEQQVSAIDYHLQWHPSHTDGLTC